MVKKPEPINYSIVATDIRNFSSVAAENKLSAIAALIQDYVALIFLIENKIQKRDEIIVNNFLGDGFLIFCKNSMDAVDFALQLRQDFRGLLSTYQNIKNIGRLGVGTGLHLGAVYYGTYGYGDRSFTTGISQHVNIAFRLEKEATKGEILVSDSMFPEIAVETISTCKDKILPKGVPVPTWPHSIFRKRGEKDTRSCCKYCTRFSFCNYNAELGRTYREVDPYCGVPGADVSTTKYIYRCTHNNNRESKMLCALPVEPVVPEEIPSSSMCVCGGCSPIWGNDLDRSRQNFPAKHCHRNLVRGFHKIEFRECCDECTRFDTCHFNLHRGKNGEQMACCENCDHFFETCPQ